MLCVMALERHGVKPSAGEIVVTVAGGVGSVAIALLSNWAIPSWPSPEGPRRGIILKQLGATGIIERAQFSAPGKFFIQRALGRACPDVVGSHTLANICAATTSRVVAVRCGLVAGMDFPATVAPFILRGVTPGGSTVWVMCPREDRLGSWRRLAKI